MYGLENARAPVCYNGNLNTLADIEEISRVFPQVERLMLGRGLIADPGLLSGGTERKTLEAFYEELLQCYLEAFGGSRNAMFRLKENWRYLICKFEGADKLEKRLRKTTDLAEYKAISREIFQNLPLRENTAVDW